MRHQAWRRLIELRRRRKRREEFRRWERDRPMQLWQMDVMGGVEHADDSELKVDTGVDDHSRFCVAAGLRRATSKAVCEVLSASLRTYEVPDEILTDNGKCFTGRFGPNPTEVPLDRVLREDGISVSGPFVSGRSALVGSRLVPSASEGARFPIGRERTLTQEGVRKMRRTVLSLSVAVAAALLVAPTSAISAVGDYSPGAPGVGDPYYPNYGNGGYDVQHYDLAIRYRPKTDYLAGVATIDAVATQGLSSFNLDFVGLAVIGITVNGEAADWSRTEHELIVVPVTPIDDASPFTTRVAYAGVPWTTFDPFGPGVQVGFMHTDDGAIVSGEPDVAAFWYPANDHPTDRATYRFAVTVPDKYGVVANGLPTGVQSSGRRATYTWEATDPMAAYLATINIGFWIVDSYKTKRGIRVIDAIDPDHPRAAQAVLAREGKVLAFLEDTFGPYPFESAGAIVDDHPRYYFAMEMQTRPVYPTAFMRWGYKEGWGASLVLHELAHMWFGDLVAVNQWKDIWLNEGIASYAEWLWAEHEGEGTPQEILEAIWSGIPADDPFWQIVIGDPSARYMFHGAVYTRGAMTVQALRNQVGDEVFWQILAEWIEKHAWATGSTEQFMALAEQVSGQDLDAFFQTWLFTPEKPPQSAVLTAVTREPGGAEASISPGAAEWADRWRVLVAKRTNAG